VELVCINAEAPSTLSNAEVPSRIEGVINQTILWRRLDRAGHEFACLCGVDSTWTLAGTAVFVHDRHPCCLDYTIACDPAWKTVSTKVTGWLADRAIEIEISVDETERWLLNGTECDAVAGCTDIDLNFSPSTNLLPIRRLDLKIGQEADVRAAWLRFPSFTLERLDQRYRRLGEDTYRYESAGGSFITELTVSSAGFVTHYPNFCEADAIL
jgi:hypothetical protein